MKIKELTATCQNQWKGQLFTHNKEFKVIIIGRNNKEILKDSCSELHNNIKWLNGIRDKQVMAWEFKEDRNLYIYAY